MGEAKKRDMTAEVGRETIEECYTVLFDIAKGVYKETGGLNHDLKGITLRDGKGAGISALLVEDPRNVQQLVQRMLGKWPLVVHTVEVWHTTKPGISARDDPNRQDAVSFIFYTRRTTMCAICPVDVTSHTLQKGALGVVASMTDSVLPDSTEPRH